MVTRVMVGVLLLVWAGGCAATVSSRPPAVGAPMTAVYIADYGIHSSVLMPTGDRRRYVEYAFGDWNFAALNHCWPQDVLGALLVSFQSALGRRYIDAPPDGQAPRPVHPSPHSIQAVYASATDVARVVREMDDRYRRHADDRRHNPENDMDYVRDDEHYSFANNCNHLTARCLREMGCDIRGFVVLSHFYVEPPPKRTAIEPIKTAGANGAATMPSAQAN